MKQIIKSLRKVFLPRLILVLTMFTGQQAFAQTLAVHTVTDAAGKTHSQLAYATTSNGVTTYTPANLKGFTITGRDQNACGTSDCSGNALHPAPFPTCTNDLAKAKNWQNWDSSNTAVNSAALLRAVQNSFGANTVRLQISEYLLLPWIPDGNPQMLDSSGHYLYTRGTANPVFDPTYAQTVVNAVRQVRALGMNVELSMQAQDAIRVDPETGIVTGLCNTSGGTEQFLPSSSLYSWDGIDQMLADAWSMLLNYNPAPGNSIYGSSTPDPDWTTYNLSSDPGILLELKNEPGGDVGCVPTYGGSGATATAVLKGDAVYTVTVTNRGSGYQYSHVLILFSGGGGGGAYATAAVFNGGAIQTIAVSAGGSGYTSAPTVTIVPQPSASDAWKTSMQMMVDTIRTIGVSNIIIIPSLSSEHMIDPADLGTATFPLVADYTSSSPAFSARIRDYATGSIFNLGDYFSLGQTSSGSPTPSMQPQLAYGIHPYPLIKGGPTKAQNCSYAELNRYDWERWFGRVAKFVPVIATEWFSGGYTNKYCWDNSKVARQNYDTLRVWGSGLTFNLGDEITDSIDIQKVTAFTSGTTGTTGTTEPVWPDILGESPHDSGNNPVPDGNIIWTDQGPEELSSMMTWQSNTPFNLKQTISDGTHAEQVQMAGTSGASMPSWNSAEGGTTKDGSITWVNLGTGFAYPYNYYQGPYSYDGIVNELSIYDKPTADVTPFTPILTTNFLKWVATAGYDNQSISITGAWDPETAGQFISTTNYDSNSGVVNDYTSITPTSFGTDSSSSYGSGFTCGANSTAPGPGSVLTEYYQNGLVTDHTLNFVFVATNDPNSGDNNLYAYGFNVGSSPSFSSVGSYNVPFQLSAIAISPDNHFLYAGGNGSIDVMQVYGSMDNTGTYGTLSTPVTALSSGPNVNAMQVSPDGHWLLVLDATTGELTPYQINLGTGVLGTAGTPVSLSGTPVSFDMVADHGYTPDNVLVFVSLGTSGMEVLTFDSLHGVLNSFNAATLVTTTPASVSAASNTSDNSVFVDPNSEYAYIVAKGTTAGTYGSMYGFSINDTNISPITPSVSLTGINATSYVVGKGAMSAAEIYTPTANYVFVANGDVNTISALTVASDHNLTHITTVANGGGTMRAITPDYSGNYLFVLASNPGIKLTAYIPNASSGLTSAVTQMTTVPAGNPIAMAATH